MPFNMILDEKKTPYPDAMPKPGGTVTLTPDNITPETHTPSAENVAAGGRSYYLRVSAPCRFSVATTDYEFDKENEAYIDSSEVRLIRLAVPGKWETLTIVGDQTSATVRLEETQ